MAEICSRKAARGIIAAGFLVMLLSGCGRNELEWYSKDITGLMPDLQFELLSETGEPVQAQLFRGQALLMFFGFTQCPDICPTTLAQLSGAVAELEPDQQENVKVLLISVDPKRDTPARLKDYTASFGPHVVGLTGTQAQLQALAKQYRVTFGYSEPDGQGNYEVSHSSAVYAFDRQGQARLLIRMDQSREEIAADIAGLLTL